MVLRWMLSRARQTRHSILMIGVFWLLISMIFAVATHGADRPSHFYAVSVFFSDHGPRFYYRILDVTQDRSDTLVRYVRIAPTNVYCPQMSVQAVEARVRNETPGKLVGANNPCAIKPDALEETLKRYPRSEGVFEAISFGVVVQYGLVLPGPTYKPAGGP